MHLPNSGNRLPGQFCDPGIGKQHINSTELPWDGFKPSVEITQLAHIGMHGQDVSPWFLGCSIECLLVAARNLDLRICLLEQSGGSQSIPLLPPVITATSLLASRWFYSF